MLKLYPFKSNVYLLIIFLFILILQSLFPTPFAANNLNSYLFYGAALRTGFRLRSPMILFFWRELLTLFCKESLFLHMSQSLFFLHVSPLALSCSTSKCCEIIIKFASDAITSSKSRKKFFSNATKSASKSENDSYNPLQFNALDCLSMETTWYTFLLHLSDLSKPFQD